MAAAAGGRREGGRGRATAEATDSDAIEAMEAPDAGPKSTVHSCFSPGPSGSKGRDATSRRGGMIGKMSCGGGDGEESEGESGGGGGGITEEEFISCHGDADADVDAERYEREEENDGRDFAAVGAGRTGRGPFGGGLEGGW